jgi:pimeloyl-ACP methyl ester carboxylesterase
VAARSPGSVAALVLAAGYPAASPEVAAELEAIAGMFDAGQTPLAAWVDLVSARWLDPEAPDALRRRDIEALLASESSPRIARALRRAAQAQTPVPRSPVPTLVLAAEDDAAVPAARARELAQSLDARFESWPGRSHFLHWRDPVAFVRRVEAFAASVAAP